MLRLDWSLLMVSPVFEVFSALLGLAVGSFANVCVHRLPVDFEPAPGRLGPLRDLLRQLRSLVHPPSHCPRCGRAIRALDNVPLLSWLVLRGRCRDCALPISVRYPALEAANGLLWLLVALRRGPRPWAFAEMAFVSAMLVLLLIDLEHQLLPDAVTLPGTLAAVLASFLPGSPVGPLAAFTAALAGYLGFRSLAWFWKRLRGIDALGQGDWKLAAMLGAFLGWERLLLTLLIASTAGSVIGVGAILARRGNWQSRLPFGSFLAAAAILVLLFGGSWLGWYRDVLRG